MTENYDKFWQEMNDKASFKDFYKEPTEQELRDAFKSARHEFYQIIKYVDEGTAFILDHWDNYVRLWDEYLRMKKRAERVTDSGRKLKFELPDKVTAEWTGDTPQQYSSPRLVSWDQIDAKTRRKIFDAWEKGKRKIIGGTHP